MTNLYFPQQERSWAFSIFTPTTGMSVIYGYQFTPTQDRVLQAVKSFKSYNHVNVLDYQHENTKNTTFFQFGRLIKNSPQTLLSLCLTYSQVRSCLIFIEN